MFDFHVHSNNSHDGKQTVDEICRTAIEKGLCGVAVCDHIDGWYLSKLDVYYEKMKKCINEVKVAKEKYGEKLKVFQGMELCEYTFDTARADDIIRLCEYDVILGSVHCLVYEDWTVPYSQINFGTAEESKLIGFMNRYFALMLEMIDTTNFDVLCHLTCPLRSINGKFLKNIDVMLFKKTIEKIYARIIEKNIALEINTSGVNSSFNSLMPTTELIKMYYGMGGRLITLASDAHVAENIGNAFDYTKKLLKDIGFNKYFCFDKRKPVEVNL